LADLGDNKRKVDFVQSMDVNERVKYLCDSLNRKFDEDPEFRVRSQNLPAEKALQYSRIFYAKGPPNWSMDLSSVLSSEESGEGDNDEGTDVDDDDDDDDDDDHDNYGHLSRRTRNFISQYALDHPAPVSADYALGLISEVMKLENRTILTEIDQEGFDLLAGMVAKLRDCGPYLDRRFRVVIPKLSAVKTANYYQLLLKEVFRNRGAPNPDTRSLYDGFYFHSQYQGEDDTDEEDDEEVLFESAVVSGSGDQVTSEQLPILEKGEDIAAALANNRVICIAGIFITSLLF